MIQAEEDEAPEQPKTGKSKTDTPSAAVEGSEEAAEDKDGADEHHEQPEAKDAKVSAAFKPATVKRSAK